MATEKRLIDIEEIVKVAEHAYQTWSLAMVGADDTRKVNEVFKKQYLCKVVKAVAENCPTVDAVEVVRCNACQSHEPCAVKGRVWCKKLCRYMKEDGFCSEGNTDA